MVAIWDGVFYCILWTEYRTAVHPAGFEHLWLLPSDQLHTLAAVTSAAYACMRVCIEVCLPTAATVCSLYVCLAEATFACVADDMIAVPARQGDAVTPSQMYHSICM